MDWKRGEVAVWCSFLRVGVQDHLLPGIGFLVRELDLKQLADEQVEEDVTKLLVVVETTEVVGHAVVPGQGRQ